MMYRNDIYTILENAPLTDAVRRMRLEGDTQWIVRPGQFVNIALEGRFLRRPISVCDYDERSIVLIYKVVGEGTAQMSRMRPGERLDLLTGLGNGFATDNDARRPLLVGGGVGVPPLYNLAKRLLAAGKPVQAVLGFNTAAEVFYADEFRALGCSVTVATADGSRGVKGFVTDALAGLDFDYFYADAPGLVAGHGVRRPAVVRGAHGLRFRRLHGLLVPDAHGRQAHLQGGPCAAQRRDTLVNR